MAKILKKKKLKNTDFILGKIKSQKIVKCPNCKTRFFRPRPDTEHCNVCMTTQKFVTC